jgi:hypothetical protein
MTESEELYGWLDSLGFADPARCPFVRVADGGWYVHGTDPPQKRFLNGFLVADDGLHFRLFLADSFRTRAFTRTPPGTDSLRAVYHEPADLRSATEQWLREHRSVFEMPGDWVQHNPQHVGCWLRDGVVRAWCCVRQGLPEPADEILALVERLHGEYQRYHDRRSLRQHVSDEIAHLLMWDVTEAFGDPAVSRSELLRRFEFILRKFPVDPDGAPAGDERFGWVAGGHARRARQAADLLRRMIAEDEEHARRPAEPLEQRLIPEQVSELIFQLRDQCGRQISDPGSCSIFADERGEASPAHQLVRLGVDAVGQLIDALEDERFTRCVGHHRSYYYSHHVLRVGDGALDILQRIAARPFWEGTSTNAAMLKDGQAAETRNKVLAWWQERQRHGEKEQLSQAVAAGDRNSPCQAGRLIERFPDAALDAIRRGAKRATDSRVHAALVGLAGQLTDPQAPAWLGEQLRGRWLSSRVAAARALWSVGRTDVLDPMLREWHQLPDHAELLNGPATSDTADITAWNQVCAGPYDLINFLVLCQRPEAVRALGAELSRLPVDHRLHLIELFSESPFVSFSWGEVLWDLPPEPPEFAEAVDDLLVHCLADVTQRHGLSGTWRGKSIRDPRLCDLAAHVLSRRRQQPSRFDLEAPLATRDRQRLDLRQSGR